MLKIIVEHIDARPSYSRHLRFRCLTCERDYSRAPIDPARGPHPERLGDLPLVESQLDLHVPAGSYPRIDFVGGGCAVVLPFELERWRGHLLHDVRAEWDYAFLAFRGLSVQEWDREEPNRVDLR